MKTLVLGVVCTLAMASVAFGQTIYDGYPSYYRTLNGIFQKEFSYPFVQRPAMVFNWQGRSIKLSVAKAFPREDALDDDLGPRALAYEAYPFACVEGQGPSPNGTAVRYKSVYLMEMTNLGKVVVYKLSSLFASCTSVRLDERKRPLIYDADYVYSAGSDTPVGLTLREYLIDHGEFVVTGNIVTTRFVEPGNVYKFEVVDVL
ncbi:MAG: hypothetical protein JWR21_815 [Herminiimonas sp.]|nr:hypothetical protein [Herminiimonas sp.]